jgi:hypothetical protein
MTDKEPEIDWSLTTWKGNRLQQHREFYKLPFRRKIELLEEMADHARATIAWRKAKGLPYIDPYSGERVPGALITREEPPTDSTSESK